MLVPPAHALTREAFFIYGRLASGKSSIWDSTAEAYRRYGNTARFHVISTEPERAYVTVERHKDWADNITIYEPERTYQGLLSACQLIHTVATKDDFLVIDSIGSCFDWVRNNWFEGHFDKDFRAYQAEGKRLVGKSAEVQPHQWIQMNEMYKQWMIGSVLGFPGHRIVVAQAEGLFERSPTSDQDWDKGHIRDTYGHIGFKPVGYKFDDYYFHSLWYAHRDPRSNKLTLKTVKDKPGRRWMDNEEVADLSIDGFVTTYLRGIANWETT